MPRYHIREYEHLTNERHYIIEAESVEEARGIAERLIPSEKPEPQHAEVHECDFEITPER